MSLRSNGAVATVVCVWSLCLSLSYRGNFGSGSAFSMSLHVAEAGHKPKVTEMQEENRQKDILFSCWFLGVIGQSKFSSQHKVWVHERVTDEVVQSVSLGILTSPSFCPAVGTRSRGPGEVKVSETPPLSTHRPLSCLEQPLLSLQSPFLSR